LTDNRMPQLNAAAPGLYGLPLLSVFRMLWKRRWTILLTSLALAAISTGLVLVLPPVYHADALVVVDSQKIPESYVVSSINSDINERLSAITQQIMSTARLLKIISTYDLYHKERETMPQEEVIIKMRRDISIDIERGWKGAKPNGFRVGYRGRNPVIVAEIANQLANLYIEENLRTRESQAAGTADFVESELVQAKKSLEETEAKVSELKLRYKGELPEEAGTLIAGISQLQTQLQGDQDAIYRLQEEKAVLETNLDTAKLSADYLTKLAATPPPVVNKPPTPHLWDADEQELRVLRGKYTDDYPQIVTLRAEIARYKQIEAEEARQAMAAHPAEQPPKAPTPAPAGPGVPAPLGIEMIQQKGNIANMNTRVQLIDKSIAGLNADRDRVINAIRDYQARLEHVPLVVQQMAAITRDYDISKRNYLSLLDKKISSGMATEMERRQQSERFIIVDPARVPEEPIEPNRPLWGSIGGLLSVALGFMVGLALELKKKALLGEWELPPQSVVLGRVPYMRVLPPPSLLKRFAVVSMATLSLGAVLAGLYLLRNRS
jgi:succinoglycan biosynthesis transport protein ExoP